MGKKILKSLLTITLLSGFANASEENDTPNEEEYIMISKQQLEEHKNQINKNLEIMKNTENRLIFLKQQNVRLEQQNDEVNQKLDIQMRQNIEVKQEISELKKVLQQILNQMQRK